MQTFSLNIHFVLFSYTIWKGPKIWEPVVWASSELCNKQHVFGICNLYDVEYISADWRINFRWSQFWALIWLFVFLLPSHFPTDFISVRGVGFPPMPHREGLMAGLYKGYYQPVNECLHAKAKLISREWFW